MATGQTNNDLLYQPDEQPPHLASLGLGFQSVMGRLAAMAATASIIAAAGGQSDSYLSWIFFSALVVCGLGHQPADLPDLAVRVRVRAQHKSPVRRLSRSAPARCWRAGRRCCPASSSCLR